MENYLEKTRFNIDFITEPGNPKKNNEDSILKGGQSGIVFGVFDGASSLVPFRDDLGRTGGLIASDIVSKTFESAEIGDSMSGIIGRSNTLLNEDMIEKNIDISHGVNRFSTTVSAVKILGDSFEWVHIGDSVILQINIDGTFELVNPYHNHDTEVLALTKNLIDEGVAISDIFENKQFLERSKILQNERNKSYGVLDGSPEANDFINTGIKSLYGVKSLLLLTDGCYIPQEIPGDNEDFAKLVQIYNTGGLQAIHTYVKDIQENDPECKKFIRYKKSDDFTALAIDF
jgi:serine/threonine protein phosphatase PrpC